MARFARIEAGIVVEMTDTDADIATLFHADLDWRDVETSIEIGWSCTDAGFQPQPPPPSMAPLTPTLSQLESELSALVARFATLKAG